MLPGKLDGRRSVLHIIVGHEPVYGATGCSKDHPHMVSLHLSLLVSVVLDAQHNRPKFFVHCSEVLVIIAKKVGPVGPGTVVDLKFGLNLGGVLQDGVLKATLILLSARVHPVSSPLSQDLLRVLIIESRKRRKRTCGCGPGLASSASSLTRLREGVGLLPCRGTWACEWGAGVGAREGLFGLGGSMHHLWHLTALVIEPGALQPVQQLKQFRH